MLPNPIANAEAQLLSELGIANMPKNVQEEILSTVGESVMKSVMLAIILKLPPEAKEAFKKLSDAKDAEGVAKLLKTHIPNPDAFIEEEARKEVAAFKAELAKKLAPQTQ